MKAEITLIEDDSDLYNLLRYAFEQDGFKLSGAQTGAGARPSNPQFIHALRGFGYTLREGA